MLINTIPAVCHQLTAFWSTTELSVWHLPPRHKQLWQRTEEGHLKMRLSECVQQLGNVTYLCCCLSESCKVQLGQQLCDELWIEVHILHLNSFVLQFNDSEKVQCEINLHQTASLSTAFGTTIFFFFFAVFKLLTQKVCFRLEIEQSNKSINFALENFIVSIPPKVLTETTFQTRIAAGLATL